MGLRLWVQKKVRKNGGKGRGMSCGKGLMVVYVQGLEGYFLERGLRKLRILVSGWKLFLLNW